MELLVAVPLIAYPIGSMSFAQKRCGETAMSELYSKGRHKVRIRSRGSDEWPSL
jgi:hypothetical protein